MNKEDIKKQLNTFEDAEWVEKYGYDGLKVIREISDDMSKEEMVYWIKDAIKLFNRILDNE